MRKVNAYFWVVLMCDFICARIHATNTLLFSYFLQLLFLEVLGKSHRIGRWRTREHDVFLNMKINCSMVCDWLTPEKG